MEASALSGGVRAVPRRSVLPASPRVLRLLSDEALVAHVRSGRDAAFEVLFDRHHRSILAFCRHMLGSREEAEDAVQQTFLSAYGAMRADERPLQFKPWLYAIARNRSLTLLRARREERGDDALENVPSLAGLADEVQQRDDLRALVADLGTLPEDQRAALILAELDDLSHDDIADVIGCERAKVKALIFQARERLLASKQARDADCGEMRELLATATGGVLRRGPVRRHLEICASCAAFRTEVRTQRAALAVVLPVVPTLALKHGALPAAMAGGQGGAAGGAAAGGAAAGGGGVAAGGGGVAAAGGAGAAGAGAASTSVGAAAVGAAQALGLKAVVATVIGVGAAGGAVAVSSSHHAVPKPHARPAHAAPAHAGPREHAKPPLTHGSAAAHRAPGTPVGVGGTTPS